MKKKKKVWQISYLKNIFNPKETTQDDKWHRNCIQAGNRKSCEWEEFAKDIDSAIAMILLFAKKLVFLALITIIHVTWAYYCGSLEFYYVWKSGDRNMHAILNTPTVNTQRAKEGRQCSIWECSGNSDKCASSKCVSQKTCFECDVCKYQTGIVPLLLSSYWHCQVRELF